ncbi:MAG: glutamate-cysteine ligase family protein [Candidatus Gastranaerophilales bacterium]|nr:glutamate-cysteine ligase family protein [Candidatus Gastranaerophilales bacterium]
MSIITQKNNSVLDKTLLSKVFFDGCKPKSNFKTGIEFEKLPVLKNNYNACDYSQSNGIRDFLYKIHKELKWDLIFEGENLIGLKNHGNLITLEPGCQFEFSTSPQNSIHSINNILKSYNNITAQYADEMGFLWLGCGAQPVSTFENINVIPKKRYGFMSEYLSKMGSLSMVMMRETAGIQVAVDFEDEQDAMKKLALALKITPVITAMFANSPIRNGKTNGYKSFRAKSWLDTDNNRCGLVSKSLINSNGKDFSFENYVNVLLNVPMIFIQRNNNFIKMNGITFKEFLSNGYAQTQAIIEDWDLHCSLYFPDVRLKNFIELRGFDSQKNNLQMAIPALWKGILYNPSAIDAVFNLTKNWKFEDIEKMRNEVPKTALDTEIQGKKVQNFALEFLEIAQESLKTFRDYNYRNEDESIYLDCIKDLTKQHKTPADVILDNWNGSWNKNLDKFIEYVKVN